MLVVFEVQAGWQTYEDFQKAVEGKVRRRIVISTTIQIASLESLRRILDRATKNWNGCNWQTEFGSRKLDLCGIRSHQAHWLAEATSGDEALAWQIAERFLSQLEEDAKRAAKHGERCFELFAASRWQEALAFAEAAVLLEATYRDPIAWPPLRDAIAEH